MLYKIQEKALALSGLRKPTYNNNLHIIEKILDLHQPLTIGELCVQMNCTHVKDIAEQILVKYRKKIAFADISHSQYTAIAVYIACKIKQFKVQKSQFIAVSRLKPGQWKDLEADFVKCAESLGFSTAAKKKKIKATELPELKLPTAEELKVEKIPEKEKVEVDPEQEAYEIWRDRLLAQAREEIKKKQFYVKGLEFNSIIKKDTVRF